MVFNAHWMKLQYLSVSCQPAPAADTIITPIFPVDIYDGRRLFKADNTYFFPSPRLALLR